VAIVIDGGTTEETLTWADEFIKDLLSESEKYHDVLLGISSDAISDTISKLAFSSDEFRAGADILGEQAYGFLYQASGEALDHAYEELFPVITTLAPPPRGAGDWIDEETFNARLAELEARYNVDSTVEEMTNKFLGINEEIWRAVDIDINKMQHDLDMIQTDFPGFVAEQTAGLLAGSFSFLLDRLIDTFFEEV